MPVVEKTALVPFSAEGMYELVNDVDSYPEFLPWCRSARLLSRNDQQLCGEIEVERVGVRQTFSTCNKLTPYERIDLQLQDGPFKKLEGHWHFQALREDACKVSLALEFEFGSRLISSAFGTVFAQIANNLVDAFCERARELAREQ